MKVQYQIDPAHSSASFSVRHMMISNVRGAFSGVTGTVAFDPDDASQSSIHAVIDATTFNTLDEKRDGHVKSPEFLDAGQFPTITFDSKQVTGGSDSWKVTGDLTLHGVTRTVTLDVEGPSPEGKDPWGNMRSGATATTRIKRADFGLTWNAPLETGGVLISDEVKIELDISMIKS